MRIILFIKQNFLQNNKGFNFLQGQLIKTKLLIVIEKPVRMKKTLLFLLLLSSILLSAQEEEQDFAEENTSDRFPIFLGIYPTLSIPLADFKTNMDKLGYGGNLEFLINMNQSPFLVGLSSSIFNFGNEKLDFVDNEGFELVWKTNSSLWDGHLVVQFEPLIEKNFQPYIMGKLGFQHFFTITRLVDKEFQDDNPLERYVDDNSWGWSYGGAVGLLVPLDKGWRIMLNARAAYQKGSEATYYAKLDNYSVQGDTLNAFERKESAVDMLQVSIGVLAYLR